MLSVLTRDGANNSGVSREDLERNIDYWRYSAYSFVRP